MVQICSYILRNGDDVPLQLRLDMERILIPQTNQLKFIATSVIDPSEEQRQQIVSFIVSLFDQYQRVFSENNSYIQDIVRDKPEIEHYLTQILTLKQLSMEYQQGSNEALMCPPEPPPSVRSTIWHRY